MILGLVALALAEEPVDLDVPADEPVFVPAGQRIAGFGGASGVGIAEQLVIGGDGGTSITTLSARFTRDGWTARLEAPVATWRTPTGRDAGLGNLRLEGVYELPQVAGLAHALGLSLGLSPGTHAWTWATRADEVWPGSGVDLCWEARSTGLGDLVLLARAAAGVHTTPGFAPLPSTWIRVQGTGGLDQSLTDRVGVVAEATVAYWEVAPMELSGFVRADPADGVRVRGGLLLPVFTWFGWTPTARPGGVREATLALQVSAAM